MAGEDDSDIPETGAVFTFGKSKFAENLPNKFWVRNDRVCQVACGDEHTCLVAESGRVFTFGSNDWGQLGLGTTNTANRPSCIKSLKHEKVTRVACGRVHTIVATESGKLYSFGANGEGQLGVDVPDSKVPLCINTLPPTQYKMITAGADHSMALTMEGRVFVWGGGSEGQLGLGEMQEAPEPTELIMDEDIISIACGYYHSAVVTVTGKLYTFGENDMGKLGLGNDILDTSVPQLVSLPEKAVQVDCGGSHTVVLTKGGSVYTFGDGDNAQLGHGTTVLETSTPERIKLNMTVSKIACGENHTALVTRKGQLMTFGDGRHGKLALGSEGYSNQFTPAKVPRFSKFEINEVSCGGCHMVVLATLKIENGYIESSESEEEDVLSKTKLSLNHSIKTDNSLDLSVSARERRRQHSSPMPQHRTLPELANSKPLPLLHSTLPRSLDQSPLKPIHGVGLHSKSQTLHQNSVRRMSESSETESENEEKRKNGNHISSAGAHSPQLSPKHLPRPLPRHRKEKQVVEEKRDLDSKEKEDSESEETKDSENEEKKDSESEEKKDTEREEEVNEDKIESITQKENNMLQSEMPKEQIKPFGKEDWESSEEEDSRGEEEEEETNKRKLPVPPPRKTKSAEDKEKKELTAEDEESEKKKEKKKAKTDIFGKTDGGLSDEDDADDESEDDDVEEEVKVKEEKVKEKKDEDDGEKDDTDKKGKKDKKDKKDKKKDKKNDKDDKKDKKDKKKKKKSKEDGEESAEEENDEKKEDEKKEKTKEKKDKKKEKDDKKKKEKEGKKKNKKDDKKNDETKDEEKDDEMKETKKDEKKEEKEEKKEKPKSTKKSRTCTIL